MNLRDYAAGRDCQIRSPVCNFQTETTVLAHLRMMNMSGLALKSPDLFGAHACSNCHDWVDHHKDLQTKVWFADGIFRTQLLLYRNGLILVEDPEWISQITRKRNRLAAKSTIASST